MFGEDGTHAGSFPPTCHHCCTDLRAAAAGSVTKKQAGRLGGSRPAECRRYCARSGTDLYVAHLVAVTLDPHPAVCPMAAWRQLGIRRWRRIGCRWRIGCRRRIRGRWWCIVGARRRLIVGGRRRRIVGARRWIVAGRGRRIVTRRRRAVGNGAADNGSGKDAAKNSGADQTTETPGLCRSGGDHRRKADARSRRGRDERFAQFVLLMDRSGADPDMNKRKSP
jgi:hypothetical protein